MYIIYEDAACLLLALIVGAFLFTASAMCVMLWKGGGIAWRWWRELALVPHWLMGRWTAEPRV